MLVLTASSSLFALGSPSNAEPSAEIVVTGVNEQSVVKLNGETALSGRTFFSSGLIETSGESAAADINFKGLGRIGISPGSVLSISFSGNTISGKLYSGRISVFSTKGTFVRIETPVNAVRNDSELPGNFTLDLRDGSPAAASITGSAYFNDGAPVGKAQTTGGGSGVWVPVLVFAAIVGTAVVVTIMNRGDDDELQVVSPVR